MLSGTTAIAGIGATEFSKNSGRSELRLAVEAITSALTDAGLTPTDVDGLVTFTMDGNAEIAVARELGIRELRFFSQIGYGGGAACGCVHQAVMAVATGTADAVVCYRALNERSGRRFGQVAAGLAGLPTTAGIDNGWHYPMGLATPAAMVAMIARRYMHDSGATSEDFGRVAVADRRHAASNPNAWFYQRQVTLAEHQASRWIAEPLRLLDCCQESDGAVAVVVTSLDRARDLRQRPAVIAAAAQGSGPDQYIMTSYYRDDLAALPEMGVVARQLWRQAGIGPADVRTAVLYDHFSPYVLMQLEELGFCERGEARHFIADGAIEMGGRLPLNPHGGQLGEAYIHGMNGIAEAVRQIRGTAVNQVPGDGPVVVTAGTGVPTSGLILSLPARRLHTAGTATRYHPDPQKFLLPCSGSSASRPSGASAGVLGKLSPWKRRRRCCSGAAMCASCPAGAGAGAGHEAWPGEGETSGRADHAADGGGCRAERATDRDRNAEGNDVEGEIAQRERGGVRLIRRPGARFSDGDRGAVRDCALGARGHRDRVLCGAGGRDRLCARPAASV
jgi:17-hydroxy-3-oxo-4-pregnene-20-carboxyl-CoA lyase